METPNISVAILTNNLHHAARDKKCCLDLNIKNVIVSDELDDLLDPIKEDAVQVVLIDAAVKGMDGASCLRALRRATRSKLLPVIMVTTESGLQNVVKAIAAGCNGYVIRPYSMTTLERHLQMALETTSVDEVEVEQLQTAQELVQQGRFDEALQEFSEIVEEENESTVWFNKGMDYLHRQKYGKAIVAFNKALALNAMYAEAYQGMAHAYKGKGDDANYRAYLDKSAEILALQDRLAELKELFAEILQANPDAVNPYNSLGIDLRKRGDYPGALHAYTQALTLTPKDENLHYNIAKACIFAKDYDRAIYHLEQAASLRDPFPEATKLLAKLRAKQYDGLAQAPQTTAADAGQAALAMDV
ncbi:tetratricopeptide repeat protein [Solidesulfovibrio magneticus]|uniref:Response regulator receiver protein n=1 Tax=Solidesulfovibrio magneticus (strain ATCC 700980 / DSM 13731 / RS-1) TaxID=573370 RepID=C4XRJ0_SOLM1|nr:tetratricopeptide repeat protein [Solidesulfovibrio magneticus]BAH75535.1 putative response regulator receiver protein [Solidesulfovibrio magneticus RS-1]